VKNFLPFSFAQKHILAVTFHSYAHYVLYFAIWLIISWKVQSLMEFLQKTPAETMLQEYGISGGLTSAENPFQLEGCISSCAHGQGRSTTDRQFFYVNSRPCEPTKVKYCNSVRAVLCCPIGLHMVKFKIPYF
jgi:hypothetical protein